MILAIHGKSKYLFEVCQILGHVYCSVVIFNINQFYFRYSSSERKCEKQFNEYIKDRIALAKAAFRQLLMETKFITDKSWQQLVRDKDR